MTGSFNNDSKRGSKKCEKNWGLPYESGCFLSAMKLIAPTPYHSRDDDVRPSGLPARSDW